MRDAMTEVERSLWEAHRGWSQRERTVRFLLRYPGWRSITAIHRDVGFCRLNSRVAEARKVFRRDGHPFDIVHSIRDGEHGYELVPLEEPELGKQAHVSRCSPQGLGRFDVAPLRLERFEVGATRKDAPGSGSSSGSNLIPELGLRHAHEDGSLVLEGQETLL